MEEKPEEAEALKQKDAAANVYDTFDMRVDRHWSDKKACSWAFDYMCLQIVPFWMIAIDAKFFLQLEEMTDRDWRIFREDFNISYKV